MPCSPTIERRFTMLELIGAMAVLSIVLTAWMGHWQATRRLHLLNQQRAAAIVVLDNTLERLQGPPELTFAELRAICLDEFDLADLPRRQSLSLRTEYRQGRIRLAIENEHGHSLAEVEVDP